MADFVLMLGPFAFQDFEVPEQIGAGGGQAMAVRKYAGGTRTIDAMGPDDDPLVWSGYFEGPDALPRCQQLDALRRQGVPLVASWAAYAYLVLIKRFQYSFRRFYHYTYELRLEVLQDLNYSPAQAQPDAGSQVQSDSGSAATGAAKVPANPPPAAAPSEGPGTSAESELGPTTPTPTEAAGWGINNP